MATLEGTPNNDVLIGFPGSNSLSGKQGDDTLFGAEGDDRIFGNQGNDYILGNQANDTLYGGKDSDKVQSDANEDWVFGDNGNDTLEGGEGNDVVRGGKENDLLSGNEGNDVLFGDSGADTLSGGDGDDIFVISRVQNNSVNTGSSTLANADLITDFSLGTDLIGLDGGLQFQDLNISQGTGDFARDTIVRDNVTGEYLAILKGINSSSIGAANFTTSLAPVTSTSTPSILEFSTSSYRADEGPSGTSEIVATVQRTGSTEGAVSVQVELDTTSTATVTEDYINNLPVTINFASGEESKTVSIPLVGDTIVEPDEQIKVKLVNPVGRVTLGSQPTATLTIINDDISIPSLLAFSTSSYSANEGNSGSPNQVVATVQRTGSREGAVSLQVELDTTSTATVTEDYINNLPVTINFASGEESKTVSIPLVGDTIFEPDEEINLKLVNPVGRGILGSQQTASFTIINDDILPTVSIAAIDEAASETGNNPATFRISRTGEGGGNLTVNLAIDGSSNNPTKPSDYTLSGGGFSVNSSNVTVTIPEGQNFVDVSLMAVDDIHAEAQETLKLKLADGNYQVDANQNNTTVAIAANDTVVVNSNDSLIDYSLAEGSFRQALLNANAFTGNDTITFNLPAGPQTINLTGVLPEISGDVTITNNTGSSNLTVRLDTGGIYRIFKVNSGVSATFDGLTIANGYTRDGAGIYNDGGTVNVTNSTLSNNTVTGDTVTGGRGGGIYNNGGTVNATNSTFSNNRLSNFFNPNLNPIPSGGGIHNEGGTVNLTNSIFSGNSGFAPSRGGAISNNSGTVNVTNGTFSGNRATNGGGISNNGLGTVKVANSTFSGNVGVRFTLGVPAGVNGAAISNQGGTVEVTSSTLSGNDAGGGSGGGIYNREGGTVKVTNSTLSGNTVGGFFENGLFGGGIYNDNGTVEVTNSTLSGNTATNAGSRGAGIYNKAGTVTLTNSTLSGNKANPSNSVPSFPSLSSPASGGGIWNGGTVNVKNTIIALNSATTDPDVFGSFASGGYNLIGDGTGSTGFTAVGDQVGTAAAPIDPLLNPLADNGGSTQTLALQRASPAINGGDPAFVLTSGPFIGPPFYDQRGISPFNRVSGGIIDIGAFEFESPLVP
ncbi:MULTISPECIES: Calx-beta domain-containing protein [unclassified Microcoleus]|uniref:Calx-beta domain-containing protein n=1 Tax=unclassified Microcoleus TaxID=2642155 RepID=UPI002FD0E809